MLNNFIQVSLHFISIFFIILFYGLFGCLIIFQSKLDTPRNSLAILPLLRCLTIFWGLSTSYLLYPENHNCCPKFPIYFSPLLPPCSARFPTQTDRPSANCRQMSIVSGLISFMRITSMGRSLGWLWKPRSLDSFLYLP